MATGKVKWFSDARGYGFIARGGEEDVFVHYSMMSGGHLSPTEESLSSPAQVPGRPSELREASLRFAVAELSRIEELLGQYNYLFQEWRQLAIRLGNRDAAEALPTVHAP